MKNMSFQVLTPQSCLSWERRDAQRFSEIRKKYNFSTFNDKTTWGEIQKKMIEGMVKLEKAFKDYICILLKKI